MNEQVSNWPAKTFISTEVSPKITRQLANKIRELTDQPLDKELIFEPIIEACKAEVIQKDDIYHYGLLIPMEGDRFRILVDPLCNVNSEDKVREIDLEKKYFEKMTRHIVAHEIAHTFFYWRDGKIRPSRSVSPNVNFGRGRSDSQIYEETFAENFARQILVPREVVYKTSKSPEFVSRKFNVTLQLAKLAISGAPMVKIYEEKDIFSKQFTKKLIYKVS